MAKINQEWRTILRQLKCDELRADIKTAENLCVVSIDRKNRIIQRLLKDLDDSEEVYAKNLQSHTQNVLKLVDIHEKRLEFWYDFYSQEKEILLKEFYEDIKTNQAALVQSKAELECVYYALEEETAVDRTKNQNKAQKTLDGFRDMVSA